MGSKHHAPHLIRIEYNKLVKAENKPKLIAKQANPIPMQKRKRLFPKGVLYCPVGKCKMKPQKGMTEELNDPTQDIFRCPGSAKANHNGHYLKVCHGILDGTFSDNSGVGILVITIEK